jgi:dTDP-4-amino-4,6-dideoxygalactose transaminase
VLSSIALVQLDKVAEHAAVRRRHVAIYEEGIADLDGVEAVARDTRDGHANHLFVVRITFADRDEVQRALADENIGTSIHFLPVHRLSAYRDRLAPHQRPLPVSERAGAEVLSLPLSPAHSDDDVRDAVAALRRVHARLAA